MSAIDEIVRSWKSGPVPTVPTYQPDPWEIEQAQLKGTPVASLENWMPKAVADWDSVLNQGILTSSASIFETQNELLKKLRQQPGYGALSDEDFKQQVEIPIIERSMQDPLVAYDYVKSMSSVGRVGLGAYAEGMDFMGGLPELVARGKSAIDVSQGVPQEGGMTEFEAHQIVSDETKKHFASKDTFSAERIAGQLAPSLIRQFGEFAILGAKLPVGVKALSKVDPLLGHAVGAAQLLGVHSAISEPEGWKDPAAKLQQVLSSAGLGAIVGSARPLLGSRVAAVGAISGGLTAHSFGKALIEGAGTDVAIKNAFDTMTTVVAFELAGATKEYSKARTATNEVRASIAKAAKDEDPTLTDKQAINRANVVLQMARVDALERASGQLIKPLEQLVKDGKATEQEQSTLAILNARRGKIKKDLDEETKKSEQFFVDEVKERFPDKIVDQASLEKVGGAMAQFFGFDPNKIAFVYNPRAFKSGNVSENVGEVLEPKEPGGRWGIMVAGTIDKEGRMPAKQHEIMNTLIHELAHIAKPSIVWPSGIEVAHHSEFKRAMAEMEKELTTKVRRPVTAEEKALLERAKQRENLTRKIGVLKKGFKLSDDEMKALIYNATGSMDELVLSKLTSVDLSKIYESLRNVASIPAVLIDEAKIGLTREEGEMLRKATGGKLENYAQLLRGYTNRPLSASDKTARAERLALMRLNAWAQRTHRSAWNLFRNEQKVKALKPGNLASSRNLFDWFSRVTGKPILEYVDATESGWKRGQKAGNDLIQEFEKATGLSEDELIKLSRESTKKISNYLFYRKATDWLALDANEAKIAKGLAALVDQGKEPAAGAAVTDAKPQGGPAANLERSLRWRKMELAFSRVEERLAMERSKEKPNKHKITNLLKYPDHFRPADLPVEDMERIILEGRKAKEAGRYKEWIASQQWGTREVYYPAEHEQEMLADDTLALVSTPSLELYEQVLKDINIDYGPLHGRKKGAKPDTQTNPYLKIKRHIYRLSTLDEMFDSFVSLNDMRMAVADQLTPQDNAAFEAYTKTLIGRNPPAGPVDQLVFKANSNWWKWGFSAHPTSVLYFGWQNLPQDFTLGSSQAAPVEATKAVGRIAKAVKSKGSVREGISSINPWLMEDYDNVFKSEIAEGKIFWDYVMMSDHTPRSRLGSVMRMLRVGEWAMPASDTMNRTPFWAVEHETAYHNLKLYREGKISMNKMLNRLKFRSMTVERKDAMLQMLQDGRDREFVNAFAKHKNMNTNLDYYRFGRSILDMDASNISWIGMTTWPRGVFEAYYQNAVKPTIQGAWLMTEPQTRAVGAKMALEGIKNFMTMSVAFYFADKVMKGTLGVKGPTDSSMDSVIVQSPMHWSPLSPGAAWLGQATADVLAPAYLGFEKMRNTPMDFFLQSIGLMEDIEQIRLGGGTPDSAFEKLTKRGLKDVEAFIPLSDVIKVWFSKANDKEGVRFYHILKQMLTDYSIDTDSELKDNFDEGLAEKMITGMFGTKRPE